MTRQDDATKLLALGLLNFADDEGYFYADAALIRSALRPLDDDSSIVRRSIEKLVQIGYIQVGDHPTHGPVGFVISFSVHQRVDRPKGSIIKGLFDSSNVRRSIADESSLEGKGKEQGTGNKEQGTETPKAPKGAASLSPEQIEVGSWFGRRASTAWSEKEAKAWAKLSPDSVTEGITVLAPPYRAKVKFTRQDLQTLLNNWLGEIDRWRNWTPPVASDVQPLASGEGMSFLDDPNALFFAEDRERELRGLNVKSDS